MTLPRLFAVLLLAAACPAGAETLSERDLRLLTEQRDSEVTTATQRANRAYRAGLEKLLLGATQAKDYPTMARIGEELSKIADITPPEPPTGLPGVVASRIEKLLTDRQWVHWGKYHYKFLKGGDFHIVETGAKGKYKIDGKTGFVPFAIDNGAAGEGLYYDEKKAGFMHFKGGPFLPE